MSTTELKELDRMVQTFPRKRIGFYPTPFHKLENLSKKYSAHLFMKREDMAGPGAISGSKMRLAEFIIGQALKDGVDTVITQGVYLTNSGMQFVTAARVAGLTPILYLTTDANEDTTSKPRGNLLLNKIMDVETHFIKTSGTEYWSAEVEAAQIVAAMEEHKARLEAQGHKVIIVPTGGAHPTGFVAHVLTFVEMITQAEAVGVDLDYIYHTAGTGTALPGMLAAKLLIGHKVKFRSIAICPYQPDYWMNPRVIAERVQHIFRELGRPVPSEDVILAEIDVDERFIGEAYAIPSAKSITAIRELAQNDGVFIGPVYTGKGFAGLLDHLQTGRVEPGSHVAFLHTGDTGNLFENEGVVGEVTSQ